MFHKSSKPYICSIPFMSMKNKNYYSTLLILAAMYTLAGCGVLGKKIKEAAWLTMVSFTVFAPGVKYVLPKPPGMVYIPQGTFHMGPQR